MHYNIQSIKRQSFVQLGFTILTTVAGFFATMLFSHMLGADLMGVYYLFMCYFSIFNLLGDGGLGVAAVKKIAEGTDTKEYFTAYAFLRFILMIVSTLIFLALFSFLPHPEIWLFVVVALIVSCGMNIVKTNVIVQDKISLSNSANGLGEMFRIISSVLMVLAGFSVFGMIGGMACGLLITLLICLKEFKPHFAKFTKQHCKTLFLFSIWAMINSSAALLMGYADTIFIGFFMDSGDVGVYRIVLTLASLVVFIASAIITTLPPKISNWYENNETDKIETVVSKSITWSLFLGVPLLVGGIILGDKLLYYFYGAEFASGYNSLIVLFVFYLLVVFTSILSTVLINSTKVKVVAIITLVALGVNTLLNFLLIQHVGILGVAISTLISEGITFICVMIAYKKMFRLNLHWKNIGKIIVCSFIMGVLVIMSGFITHYSNVVVTTLTVIFGALLYFGLMTLLTKKFKTFK